MLRVDPRQRTRLIEIVRNMAERIREAKANGWPGEVEGLTVSLTAAEAKLAGLDRAARNDPGPMLLGLPSVAPTATRQQVNRAPRPHRP